MDLREQVTQWLRLYALRFVDEAETVLRMEELARAPGEPFQREHWSPGHFTASAFVLSPSEDRLLLILHAKLGLWLQPGGHVEPADASLQAAAEREVAEEVGLSAPELLLPELFDLDIHTIPARGSAPEHLHFDLRLLYRSPTWEVQAGSDAKAARWVTSAELDALPSDESVWRAARKLRALGYWKS